MSSTSATFERRRRLGSQRHLDSSDEGTTHLYAKWRRCTFEPGRTGPELHTSLYDSPVTPRQPLANRSGRGANLSEAASWRFDLARASAAILVLLGHLRALFFVPFGEVRHPNLVLRGVYFATSLGHQAVMLFFVLSGYLISSSVLRAMAEDRWSWSWYLSRRVTRLCVVLFPALLLTLLLDHLGMRLFGGGGVYGQSPQYASILPFAVWQRDGLGILATNATFLQGIVGPTFGSNGALWSLAYEFWYYLLFPLLALAVLVRRNRLATSMALVGLLMFVGFPIAVSFLIWLFGWAAAALPASGHLLERRLTRLIASAAVAGVVVAALVIARFVLPGLPGDFVVGIATAAMLYVLARGSPGTDRPPAVAVRAAKGLAGFSYSLYVVHLPLLVFVRAWAERAGHTTWEPDHAHLAFGLLLAFGVLACAFGFAWVTERQTDRIRRRLTSSRGHRPRVARLAV